MTNQSQTQSVEEQIEEIVSQIVCDDLSKDRLRWLLKQFHHSHTQAVAQDILLRSDELEVLCSKDGDKGTHQWRMFKHFRNKIVDTYIKSNPTNHE